MQTLERTILDPDTIPSVALDFMNNTHFEEIALVQDIGFTITQYQENRPHTDKDKRLALEKKITHLLHLWLKHTEAHFSRENELMVECHFPAYSIHANEHKVALETIENVVRQWDRHKNPGQLADYIFHTWPKWFSEHVNSMDMMTARYAVMHGFTPQH